MKISLQFGFLFLGLSSPGTRSPIALSLTRTHIHLQPNSIARYAPHMVEEKREGGTNLFLSIIVVPNALCVCDDFFFRFKQPLPFRPRQ